MNVYHRYLNLPFELTKPETFDTFKPEKISHVHLPNYADTSIMEEYLNSKDLTVLHTESFCSPPGVSLQVHLDEMEENIDVIKIIQTWGPNDKRSVTRFWESDQTYLKDHPAFKDESREEMVPCVSIVSDIDNSEFMYEANTDRPSIINAGLLHDTFNPGPEHRWTLCFVIGKKNESFLSFNEVLEILKDDISD